MFAIVAIVVAMLAAGAYLYRETTAPPELTPEETVGEFLSAVFLAKDPHRAERVVCSDWDPADAVARTTKEVGEGASVSWDDIQILSSTDSRISARARLGIRQPDDTRPSIYHQWRFSLVQEDGWRVCEARPYVV